MERNIPTPIKIDLLKYNINEEEIGDQEDVFEQKLRQEEHEARPLFEPMFQDFYFARASEAPTTIVSEDLIILPKEKDNTINKENMGTKEYTHHSVSAKVLSK